jgi:hypothetical protein
MICFFYLRGLCITPDHESCQQNVDSVHDRLYWLTQRRFESEFNLQLLNKTQIANRDRFRPPSSSRHPLTRE